MAEQKQAVPKEHRATPAEIVLQAKIQKMIDKPESSVKAIASVSIGGEYAIHGIKIIDSDKGKFVSMPNEKWTDASGNVKYKDTFHAITAEARQNLVNTVMAAYEQAQTQDQDSTQKEETADDELPDPAQEM